MHGWLSASVILRTSLTASGNSSDLRHKMSSETASDFLAA
jgi:hypothetical protein